MADMLERLYAAKSRADGDVRAREHYAAYVEDRIEHGEWSTADVAEYKAEVGRIMANGTPDEKAAAREFWEYKAAGLDRGRGINERIRAGIAADRLDAA